MRKFITTHTHTHTHMTLDKFDFALLKLLQKDSLIPLRELAIGNIAVLDPDKLNQVITILVEIRVNKPMLLILNLLKQASLGQKYSNAIMLRVKPISF